MDQQTQDQDIFFQPNDYPLTPGLRLLEASAGTGKTFALAHLVLRLLTEGKHPWEEILVVTFTDAAAAELRDRIGKRLEAALEGLEAINRQQQPRQQQPQDIDPVLTDWLDRQGGDHQRRHRWASILLEALESLDRADITTIHGFCRRTLRRQALESGAAMDPSIEGEGQQLVLEVVHDYWQQEILTLPPEQMRGLQDAGLTSTKLSKALLKIDSDPGLSIEQSSASLAPSLPLASQFEVWLEQQWQDFVSHWRSQGKELESDFCSRASEWRNQGASSAEIRPFSIRPKSDRCAALNRWIESISDESSDDDQIPCPGYGAIRDQKKLLAEYFHPAVWCKTSRRCGDDQPVLSRPHLQEAIGQLWDGPAEQVWNHALSRGLDELAERRRQKGVISYGGLLASLDPARVQADEQPVWIDLLRDRYKVTLIDEFQDTDPVQWRLFEQAFGKSKDHLLLMVGDPKQAIYRFRGSDLNTYIKARASCQRIDVLRDNYRATAPLMEALNRLMATGMCRSGLTVPALIPKSDTPPLPLPKERSPLQLINLDPQFQLGSHSREISTPAPEPLSKTAIEKNIPTAVTNAVLELLQTHSELLPAEICLLVASHRQAADLRTSLGQHGLPTKLVSQGDVLSSEAAEVLQRFLDCLAAPGQTARLRLVACSALLQWSTEQLREAEADGALDQLALRFQQWGENLPRLGLQGCLAQLLEGRTMADLSERGRLLGDLNQSAQLTQEAMHQQGLDAASAADWLRRQRLQPVEVVPDHRQPHSDMAESAVAVVTVHRSKGLEYPVVICPYLWEAPGDEDGPLWRVDRDQSWCIAINKSWGKGWQVAQQTHLDRLQEAERLAYVAMTRARRQLILFWARGQKEQGNPLATWLFGPQSIESPVAELTPERMERWLRGQNVPISIHTARTTASERPWERSPGKQQLSLGPTPQRRLDLSWGRSSYSAWIASHPNSLSSVNGIVPAVNRAMDEGLDRDQRTSEQLIVEQQSIERPSAAVSANAAKVEVALKDGKDVNDKHPLPRDWPDQGDLANFPRGAAAGDCLHRILEHLDFSKPLTTSIATDLIEAELRRSGLDPNLLSAVQNGLQRVISTPLGAELGGLRLNQLDQRRRLHELSFDLPVAQTGNPLQTADLVRVFQQNPTSRFGPSYADQLRGLKIRSRGFLTGSIDLVFTDHAEVSSARWWVADWKSNWIGRRGGSGEPSGCGPIDYDDGAMEKQMLLHHYPLQAHLYLVALHRFLRWRLIDYDPHHHLGGYAYVFLRGLPGEAAMAGRPLKGQIPGLLVEPAPVDRVIALDRLLAEGGR